jgi:hypothetical protein
MAWTVTHIEEIADSTDTGTFDSVLTTIEFTAGKTYVASVGVIDAAAEAAGDPASVGSSDGTAVFTKAANGLVYSTNRNLSWWYYKPGSTLTGKTFRVVYDDAGTGCLAHLIQIDESTATPPIVVANIKTDDETDTDVTVTPDALQAATSLQLAATCANETAAQTFSGTDWAAVASATASINTPNARLSVAKNDVGVAQAVTATGTGSVGRAMSSIEIQAGAATGHPAGRRFGLSLSRNTQHGIEGVRIF